MSRLMQCSKMLYAEAAPVLYRNTSFVIYVLRPDYLSRGRYIDCKFLTYLARRVDISIAFDFFCQPDHGPHFEANTKKEIKNATAKLIQTIRLVAQNSNVRVAEVIVVEAYGPLDDKTKQWVMDDIGPVLAAAKPTASATVIWDEWDGTFPDVLY